MFWDVFLYTLLVSAIFFLLYSFSTVIQLLRLKKKLKENWCYLDLQFHQRHALCGQLVDKLHEIPDTQSIAERLDELIQQARTDNNQVEVTGGAKSPYLLGFIEKEERLKTAINTFSKRFNSAPDSETKREILPLILQLKLSAQKESQYKLRYNESKIALERYQARFPAKTLAKKIDVPDYKEIP